MKRIVEDYEAKLRPPSGAGDGAGKAEWERDGNDDVQLSVRFRGLDVPDGATLEVRVGGGTIGSVLVSRGAGRLDIDSADGVIVPVTVDGRPVEVLHIGVPLLSGVFVPD